MSGFTRPFVECSIGLCLYGVALSTSGADTPALIQGMRDSFLLASGPVVYALVLMLRPNPEERWRIAWEGRAALQTGITAALLFTAFGNGLTWLIAKLGVLGVYQVFVPGSIQDPDNLFNAMLAFPGTAATLLVMCGWAFFGCWVALRVERHGLLCLAIASVLYGLLNALPLLILVSPQQILSEPISAQVGAHSGALGAILVMALVKAIVAFLVCLPGFLLTQRRHSEHRRRFRRIAALAGPEHTREIQDVVDLVTDRARARAPDWQSQL